MSGKVILTWVLTNWPMDNYASIFFGVLVLVGFFVLFTKYRPKSWTSKRDLVGRGLYQLFRGVFMTIISPWLMLRAWGFSKNGGDTYHFDPIKFFFNTASFTGILLLLLSGRTVENLCFGPNVEDKATVVRVVKKVGRKLRRKRGKASKPTTAPKKYRCWIQASKLTVAPISFYALMMILLFCGMFYYRRDLKEGDKSGGGLADVVEGVGRILAYKYGGADAGAAMGGGSSSSSTTSTTSSTTTTASSNDDASGGSMGSMGGSDVDVNLPKSTGEGKGKRKKKQGIIVAEKDDPFLK